MEWLAVDAPTGWGLLAAGAALLLAATALTAHRPAEPVPDLGGYLRRWRDVHGGYDPAAGSVWVRGWLTLTYRAARPLAAAGVSPTVLTTWSVWLAVAVVACAQAGGRWALAAGALVVVSGLGDSLDGAVAVMTGRATRWGYVLDSAVDRCSDLLYLLALVAAGAPAALAVGCGVAVLLLEYVRARGANAGAGDIGTVTVGERANRVAFCAGGLLSAGVFVAQAGVAVTAALAVLTALSVVGLGQLVVALRRALA